jgi:hypothetical protein
VIQTAIEIETSAEDVWAILTDFPRFSEWNPFVCQVSGTPNVGARLTVEVKISPLPRSTFHPRVLRVDPPNELRWKADLLWFGSLTGEHRMALESLGPGRVRFFNEERFGGPFSKLLEGAMGRSRPRYEAMNAALKARAERRPAMEDVG